MIVAWGFDTHGRGPDGPWTVAEVRCAPDASGRPQVLVCDKHGSEKKAPIAQLTGWPEAQALWHQEQTRWQQLREMNLWLPGADPQQPTVTSAQTLKALGRRDSKWVGFGPSPSQDGFKMSGRAFRALIGALRAVQETIRPLGQPVTHADETAASTHADDLYEQLYELDNRRIRKRDLEVGSVLWPWKPDQQAGPWTVVDLAVSPVGRHTSVKIRDADGQVRTVALIDAAHTEADRQIRDGLIADMHKSIEEDIACYRRWVQQTTGAEGWAAYIVRSPGIAISEVLCDVHLPEVVALLHRPVDERPVTAASSLLLS